MQSTSVPEWPRVRGRSNSLYKAFGLPHIGVRELCDGMMKDGNELALSIGSISKKHHTETPDGAVLILLQLRILDSRLLDTRSTTSCLSYGYTRIAMRWFWKLSIVGRFV